METMQDSETGEILYLPLAKTEIKAKRVITYDEETGEPQHNPRQWDADEETNRETGEPECDSIKLHFPKTKFNVPKKYLEKSNQEPIPKCALRDSNDTYSLCDTKRAIHFKEEIILGYNKTSHRLFLIPSLFLFFKWTAIFISIAEVFLHIWAHKKNATNKNKNLYYRSPLHILTSQFCKVCVNERTCKDINRIHDRSRRLYMNLKRVSKSLS